MKKFIATVVLIGTLYPFIWVALYFVGLFQEINWPVQLTILMLVGVGILIFYVVHIVRNSQLSNNQKVTWIFLLTIFGSVTQVVYYLNHYSSK